MRSLRLLTVPALALVLAAPAMAQRAAHGNAKNAQAADDGKETTSDQQASVDPKTGKLRQPTSDEIQSLTQSLEPALSHSSEGLTEVRNADGSVSVDLQGRFQDAVLAKVNPDGSVEQRCVSSRKEAEAFLKDKAASKPQSKSTARPATTVPQAVK